MSSLKKTSTLFGLGCGILIGAVLASTFKALVFIALAAGSFCIVRYGRKWGESE